MTPAADSRPLLVTGANGFTGSHLARTLVERGHEVRALVRPGADLSSLDGVDVEIAEGELTDPRDVSRAARGVRAIYHIAAAFRIAGKPESYYHRVNVGGTENVLQAVLEQSVGKLVHCSTIGIHGDCREIPCNEESPPNPGDSYQRTKWEAEQRVREAARLGLRVVVVRPAGIYGPGDTRFLKLFRTIDNGSFRMIGSGKTLFHMVYVDDLVNGMILAGAQPQASGRPYILAGPDSVTLDQLTLAIARELDVELPRGRIPVAPVLLAARLCEAVCGPLGIEPPLHQRRVHFFTKNRAFDISRARIELGYAPRVGTAEGVRRMSEWFIREGYLPAREGRSGRGSDGWNRGADDVPDARGPERVAR